MTAKEMMESLSDALMSDARILSVQERELLANLLRRAKISVGAENHVVTDTITRLVGELVAERAYGVLRHSIARRLIEQPLPESGDLSTEVRQNGAEAAGSALRPSQRSGMNFQPHPPSPQGPLPPSPGPPGPRAATGQKTLTRKSVALLETAEVLPANYLVLDEFLAPAEVDALMKYTLEQEAGFQISEVIAPGAEGGGIDYEHRRSRVLMDLGKHEDVIVNRIRSCWPRVLSKLGHEDFAVSRVEAQITASNDGDFFHWHTDDGHPDTAAREITFVYFFHREPKAFRGGELRIYDSKLHNGAYVATENYRVAVPQQNQMVLFDSGLAHEISPVECASKAFADSRFTVNGWFRR
jgi:Rps23 Pro-64 3,4-dihydroxylase Tpa1-like proline 4-hydroxylase